MNDQKNLENSNGSQIAIIGMSCRFPGAPDIGAYWNNLRNGVESISFFTDEQLRESGVGDGALAKKNYIKARSIIDGAELFDAAFFGFSPRSAEGMDPQLRLFLECVWEAIESAGYNTESYQGAISLFAGSTMSSYLTNNLYANPEAFALAGEFESVLLNAPGSLATLVAYKLNLKGGCFTIGTFCSTSLVAVHMACQSLLNFESDIALAGGVTIGVPQNTGYFYQEGQIESPDGHCRPFDARAQGTVFGNGLGVVALKRLEDALADGDHIEAVILGSATNNDGSFKASYTAPSVSGQAEVIAEAQSNAEVEPETITYVETHGTATTIGDPMEIAALNQVFLAGTQKKGYCAIGSVKSNIGHLDSAAGVAGLIKTTLALKHKEIPPTLHFEKPNPNIDFNNSPFYVNTRLATWESGGLPRRAGVSSFGVGGTNAHVVLQEAPELEPSSASRSHQLLVLSAKTGSALEAATANLSTWLKQHPGLNLADIAYTLQVGRQDFNYRRIIVCEDIGDAVSTMETGDSKRILTVNQEKRNPPVVFVFSGQGSQYVNMGADLYRNEPVFQEEVDRCCEILKPQLGFDLRDILYPDASNAEEAGKKITQTYITQPALFTIEYALARLWMSWGVYPSAMVGHSIGEYVAACLAGVFSLKDALELVAARGRLMQELPGGSMLAVFLSEEEVKPYLSEKLSLAVINGPSLCVISGEYSDIETLEKQLSGRNITCRHVHTSHAFHSRMMEPILGEFTERVRQVNPGAPEIPFVSNFTGTWITPDEAKDPDYWARQLRHTVRFNDCLQELLKEPGRIILEVGPGRTFSGLAEQHPDKTNEHVVLSSTRHPKESGSDIAYILNTLGQLWMAGVKLDWSAFYKDEKRHRLPLPTYPFERQRHWIEPTEPPRGYFASKTGISEIVNKPEGREQPGLSNNHVAPADTEGINDHPVSENEIENTIAGIWQKILGVKNIGVDDDYFKLGGTSLIAVRLFAEIETILGQKLPLATLYEAPTIHQLAAILRDGEEKEPWRSLVAIQPGESDPPIFFIHAAGGNVLSYHDLAHHLDSERAIYGLQAQGLNGERPFHTRIEDMAAQYIQEIQTVQPEGPYLLAGYCMGGTVALEMAQRLQAEGHKVALLALFETYNWAKLPAMSLFDNTYRNLQRIGFVWGKFLHSESKLKYIREKAKTVINRNSVRLESMSPKLSGKFCMVSNEDLILFKLREANDQAVFNYVPSIYPGRITQFVPDKEYAFNKRPELSWEKLAAGGLEIHNLPTYPEEMFKEPFVTLLAEKLNACIKKALETERS